MTVDELKSRLEQLEIKVDDLEQGSLSKAKAVAPVAQTATLNEVINKLNELILRLD